MDETVFFASLFSDISISELLSFLRPVSLKTDLHRRVHFLNVHFQMHIPGYRTFCVFFNANGASVYRASLAFIFSEMIFEGGQKVL